MPTISGLIHIGLLSLVLVDVALTQNCRRMSIAVLEKKATQAIARCTDSNHKVWKHYGGRGIQVFSEWIADPLKFIEYLYSLPGCMDPSLVLDREDNDGDYRPGNLRFVTLKESRRNQRPIVNTALKEREYVKLNYPSLSEKRGLISQRQFAASIGVPNRLISLIERGITYGIGQQKLKKILIAYKISLD